MLTLTDGDVMADGDEHAPRREPMSTARMPMRAMSSLAMSRRRCRRNITQTNEPADRFRETTLILSDRSRRRESALAIPIKAGGASGVAFVVPQTGGPRRVPTSQQLARPDGSEPPTAGTNPLAWYALG